MSTLTIPNKIKNHAPKPTKTQLVEALLVTAKERHYSNKEINNGKRKVIEQEVKKEICEILKINESMVHISIFGDNMTVNLTGLQNSSIKKLIKKHSSIPTDLWFDSKAIKRKILESLAAKNPLLNNSEMTLALRDILDRIFNITPAIEA